MAQVVCKGFSVHTQALVYEYEALYFCTSAEISGLGIHVFLLIVYCILPVSARPAGSVARSQILLDTS